MLPASYVIANQEGSCYWSLHNHYHAEITYQKFGKTCSRSHPLGY